MHLNFQRAGGGHLESGRSFPVLHFSLWLDAKNLLIKFYWNQMKSD
jgi:hypothetical protein